MTETNTRWCILRMAASRTLLVAKSLRAAGIDAWTPQRTFKRARPGRCNLIDGRKPTIEVDAPIMPTFVFAPADRLIELEVAARDPACRFPPFSVMYHAGRVPLIGAAAIAGLHAEEAREVERFQAERDQETRTQARAERSLALRTERARRKAMRVERREFAVGQEVAVSAPAFAGVVGVIERSNGRSAVIRFGSIEIEVEAWQVIPNDVRGSQLAMSIAA